MILLDNLSAPGVNDAYMLGMSLDNSPGNLFLQKNKSPGTISYPATLSNFAIGTTITAGLWYTVKAVVSGGAGSTSFQAKIWPRSSPEPAGWSLNYVDSLSLPCTAISGGTYLVGWQADGTSPTDYFSNLKVYGPGPAVNPRIFDNIPSGVSYLGSGTAPATGPPALSWSFPGTFFGQSAPLTWWGRVACPGPVINQFSMNANSIPVTTSNSVTLTVGCSTSTPTPTPTATGTRTPIPIPTATCIPYAWPNPYNPNYAVRGTFKIDCLLPGDFVFFYTVSGELVNKLTAVGSQVEWNGLNQSGGRVSSGIYYWVVQRGNKVVSEGKLLVQNSG
jgi:hypothetical protein